ncbi:MAG: hypothetical protein HYX74_06715 [Acidobacteria bacterium]|nr:hypothetical protein [Acidobacteriota bacterium]
MHSRPNRFKLILSIVAAALFFGPEPRAASPLDRAPAASCAEFMAAKYQVDGRQVGQEDCLMRDTGVVDSSRKYRRVDIGISGTADGWIVKEGPRSNHFTSAPDFLFTQVGNHYRRFHGVLRYEASKGTSMTLVYPETAWNGKLYLTAHGSSGSFLGGTLKPWDENFNPAKPLGDLSKYEKQMLEKGYAVVKTRRNADKRLAGDFSITLDNGEVVAGQNIANHPGILLDMARLAKNFLENRLGRRPSRTYWYGHSGGVMVGRLIHYLPGQNRDSDGKPTIDGFLFDDPGGGLWLPVLTKDGQNVLFRTQQERDQFVKTIEIAHQLYPGRFTAATPLEMDIERVPEWVSPVYLINKRTAARLFKEKGLDGKYRMYEVRGVSHSGGEDLENGKKGDIEILELSRLIDGAIDLLDNWVEKGVEPPPTKSDLAELGDRNSDGINENEAIDLPETACPLGVYYPYPPSLGPGGAGSTSFASFDEKSLEPVDGRGVFVDMNLNRCHDYRETVTQAWRRLGLLQPQESFSRARYVDCIKAAASRLRKENLVTEKVAESYVREAAGKELPQ